MIIIKAKKEVNKLVSLYFYINPNMNKGMAFRIKANDVITQYYFAYDKSYEEIEHCIRSQPMCQKPIWIQFKDYFYNKKKENSHYKSSIEDSTNIDDWM